MSIKSSTMRGFGSIDFKPGGRLVAINVNVHQLVNAAYGISGSSRIAKGPNCPHWIESERFNVEAVAEEGTIRGNLSTSQLKGRMQPLIQRLLADRFALVIGRSSRDMTVYNLSATPSGIKLDRASVAQADCEIGADCHSLTGNRLQGLRGTAVSMADLVAELEAWTDRPVVDTTNITGLYSFYIKPFASLKPHMDDFLAALPEDRRPPPEPAKPSLTSILEKDFGLILRAGRGRIEIIQIESCSRPSAN